MSKTVAEIISIGNELLSGITVNTNASFIVGSKFDFNDGLFSGYDPKAKKYDKSQWAFEKDENGVPKRDLTLKDPGCVFQLMKKHYSRYTPETVSAITGTPEKDLKKVWETYAETGAVDKTGTIMAGFKPIVGTLAREPIRVGDIGTRRRTMDMVIKYSRISAMLVN